MSASEKTPCVAISLSEEKIVIPSFDFSNNVNSKLLNIYYKYIKTEYLLFFTPPPPPKKKNSLPHS